MLTRRIGKAGGGCCCGGSPANCGSCCICTTPCAIPKADLTLTWASALIGNGSCTLVWNGTSWQSGCNAATGMQFGLTCVSNQITLTITYYLSGSCPTGQSQTCVYPGTAPFAITLSSYTCNPLSLSFTVDGTNCPAVFSGSGITAITITGPTYGASTCCQTFAVAGCNSLALPGATVSVYDHAGGTLLASAVTPASGIVALLWSGSCSVYVTVTEASGRLNAYGSSLTLPGAGTKAITLTPAAGYACCISCILPVSNSPSLTDANGSYTMTGGSGLWQCCYDIQVPGSDCFNGFLNPITLGIKYFFQCYSPGKYGISRQWATDSNVIYANQHCSGVSPGCSGYPGLQNNTSDTPAGFSPSPCAPIAFSGALIPHGLNGTGDPVGGSVTVTA